MPTLRKKGDATYIRFRFSKRQYERSLGEVSERDASAVAGMARHTLRRMELGLLKLPEGADLVEFIISGGESKPPNQDKPVSCTLAQARIRFKEEQAVHLAESYLNAMNTHLGQLAKFLGRTSKPKLLCEILQSDIEQFLAKRAKKAATATLIRTRNTMRRFFAWCVQKQFISRSPAEAIRPFKEDGDAPPFATKTQIEEIIDRGGLKPSEVRARWKRLFLSPDEIAAVLKLVKERADDQRSYMLHAIAAYTGMRRGEILRLRWEDIDFEHGVIQAKSRKASRRKKNSIRFVQLHSELRTTFEEWRGKQRSPYVVGRPVGTAPLTVHESNRLFWQPLRDTTWCLCSEKNWFKFGFHMYRHSFVSNLAAAGVDQRVIDEFVGHETEAMRRRYRHLFPNNRKEAIQVFSLMATDPPCQVPESADHCN